MNIERGLFFDGGFIRPLGIEDVYDGYIVGLNDSVVNRYLEVRHEYQSEQSVARFVENNQKSADAVLFGIWLKDQDHHCGTVRLHEISLTEKSAYIGICIFDKKSWGQGLGTKSISTVTKWALDGLGLLKIEAGAYADNIASQKAFLNAGYEWTHDIQGKYIFESKPVTVKIFAARSQSNL